MTRIYIPGVISSVSIFSSKSFDDIFSNSNNNERNALFMYPKHLINVQSRKLNSYDVYSFLRTANLYESSVFVSNNFFYIPEPDGTDVKCFSVDLIV